MPVSLAPVPRQQYTDENGRPIVGGKLFTYLTNTSTKAATYTDGSGTSANTNPIILDDQGRIPNGLFLINGVSYKFVLAIATDIDPPTSPIFTENDITGINDTTTIDAEYALLAAAVSDMANDAILSAVEKSLLRKEWDAIASEKIVLENQADTYGITTQKTSYTAAWVALADYLNESVAWVSGVPKWLSDAELGNDTVIVPATFRLTFRTYYDTRTTLIKQITDVANTNTSAAALTAYWTSVSGRPTDLTSLDPTSATALSTATQAIADIASDNQFTSVEKINIRRKWDTIAIEKAIIEAQATLLLVTTEKTAYTVAWLALAKYLNNNVDWVSGIPSWINDANLGTTTAITGSVFRSKFTAYYEALSNLQKAISAAEKTYREAAQSDATAALAALADIAADSKLTPPEKFEVRQIWDKLLVEKTALEATATSYGITTEKTDYTTQFGILATYLNNGSTWTSGTPTWIADANLGTTTTIIASTFRNKFETFYTYRDDLKKKINFTAINPGTQITSSNNTSYVGANALTDVVSAEGTGTTTTTQSTTTYMNSNSGSVTVWISATVTSKINATTDGVTEIVFDLYVGSSHRYSKTVASIPNSYTSDPHVATASKQLQIDSPGSGSVSYEFQITRASTGTGTGGSVGYESILIMWLKR